MNCTGGVSGNRTCACTANYFTNADGSCTRCAANRVSAAGSTSPAACVCKASTYYGGVGVNVACSNCQGNTFSTQNSSACTECPSGAIAMYPPTSASSCVTPSNVTAGTACTSDADCGANELSYIFCKGTVNGSKTCACLANYYANADGLCTACSYNRVSPAGSTSISACICSEGSYSDGSGPCYPCPNNAISAPGSATCTACPIGAVTKYVSPLIAHCVAVIGTSCVSDSNCSAVGSIPHLLCLQSTGTCSCAANYFAVGGACAACSETRSAPPGSLSIAACQCKAGTYSSSLLVNSPCTPCSAGMTSLPGAAACFVPDAAVTHQPSAAPSSLVFGGTVTVYLPPGEFCASDAACSSHLCRGGVCCSRRVSPSCLECSRIATSTVAIGMCKSAVDPAACIASPGPRDIPTGNDFIYLAAGAAGNSRGEDVILAGAALCAKLVEANSPHQCAAAGTENGAAAVDASGAAAFYVGTAADLHILRSA